MRGGGSGRRGVGVGGFDDDTEATWVGPTKRNISHAKKDLAQQNKVSQCGQAHVQTQV